jgi:calpain-15
MEKIDPTFLKRIESEENYTDIIKSGEPFKDENFLPDSSSLFNPNFTKLSSGEMKTWKKFTWKRAPEHFKGEEFSVFHGIEPNDIKQGNLGNCYFLSALSSMAEFPQRIKDIFPIHKVNSAGCYPMNLCVNGQFIIIIVDDYFPYDPLNEVPAFSKANENELWVLLLEKAWVSCFRVCFF